METAPIVAIMAIVAADRRLDASPWDLSGMGVTSPGGDLTEMGRQPVVALYVLAMAALILGLDFTIFRNRFWERLIVNIGIVLVFAAFYLSFLRQP